jgi:hypothetical protein
LTEFVLVVLLQKDRLFQHELAFHVALLHCDYPVGFACAFLPTAIMASCRFGFCTG